MDTSLRAWHMHFRLNSLCCCCGSFYFTVSFFGQQGTYPNSWNVCYQCYQQNSYQFSLCNVVCGLCTGRGGGGCVCVCNNILLWTSSEAYKIISSLVPSLSVTICGFSPKHSSWTRNCSSWIKKEFWELLVKCLDSHEESIKILLVS